MPSQFGEPKWSLSCNKWFGTLNQCAWVIVAFLRRTHAGLMPASTGRLSVGMGRRQPVSVRRSVFLMGLRLPMSRMLRHNT